MSSSFFEDLAGFCDLKQMREDRAREYRMGLIAGYARGFNRAKEHIAAMLEEEGKGITAAKVRKMELKKKS